MSKGFDAAPALSLLASQWRLTHIQLVNWGTFCGYRHLLIVDKKGKPADVCMITGESGTGKSTLFDAKTAVLMRGTARFNTASNQTTGRARGSRERNLYSYVMGKQDDEYDPQTGESHESYLRTTATANWSAIFLTFLCDTGETYCAGRLYYVAAHTTGVPDTWCITADTELDPRAMSGHAQTKIGRASIRAAYPKATVHESQEAFLRTVYRKLGIGHDGEGDSAMKLQERIQAGTTITDVDALFKDLVIGEPSTYKKAEEACTSYVEHEATWEEMDKARRKVRDLSPIRETYQAYQDLDAEDALIESCRPDEDGPLRLTLAQRGGAVFDQLVDECAKRVAHLERKIVEAEEERTQEAAQLDFIRDEVAGRGGDAIDHLKDNLEREQERLEDVRTQRARVEGLLAGIGRRLPGDAAAFEALENEAGAFVDSYDAKKNAYDDRRVEAQIATRDLGKRKDSLERDLRFYRSHPSNITRNMRRDREQIVRATGIPESELPYAAELMDMAEGERAWSVAANVGFHGAATLMLVDRAELDAFSTTINELHLDHRITFQGVRKRAFRKPRNEPDKLSSKLVFKEESPFAAWVCEWVHDSAHDFVCVNSAAELGGRGQRITREGQTRQRNRGAHGYTTDSLVIGFSNTERIAQAEHELAKVLSELDQAHAALKDALDALRALDKRRDVALQILPLRWEALDEKRHTERIARLEADIERLESDVELSELMRRRDELTAAVRRLDQTIGVLGNEKKQEELQLEVAQGKGRRLRERCEQLVAQGVSVSPEQEALINEHVGRAEAPFATDDGKRALARQYGEGRIADTVTRSMHSRVRAVRDQAAEKEAQLTRAFENYKERWLDFDDPTGTNLESYPDYLRILEELEQEQLDLHIDDWLVDTLRRAGAALVPLARAYTTDLREIKRRMDPINQIMGKFSFGPEEGRLNIMVTQRMPQSIRAFRKELAQWASLATQSEFEDADALHLRLRAFMAKLQDALARRANGPLNTKRLVYITVVAHYPDKPQIPDKAYSSLGAKSGGETQELIAFILGAALLFCLGDNGEMRPTYAPVFLDEAFIKADERFTRRAITALTGLGFQVIIAVPTSKVQAVEPVATEYICVTKDPTSSHSFITEMVGKRSHA